MPFGPTSAFVQVNAAAPTGRASATVVMLGLAALVTPVTSGRMVVIASGVVGNNTTTDGANFQLYFGTGAAPVNGAAVTGTAFGGANAIASFVTSELTTSFCLTGSFTVTGQQYLGTGVAPTVTQQWIDIGFSSAAGTVTFTTVNLIAFEV